MKKNSPINKNGEPINVASSTQISGLGVNSQFHKIKVFLGHKLTKKLTKNSTYRNSTKEEKELSSSKKDYIEGNKRKHLSIKSGFGQKSFNFLGSDITLTGDKIAKIIASGLDTNRIERAVSNEHGITDSYACIYKTSRKVTMTNRMSGYDAKIKLHLIEIIDPKCDIKTLIKDITHNRNNKNTTNNLRKSSETLLDTAGKLINGIDELIQINNKDAKGTKQTKENIRNLIENEIGEQFRKSISEADKAEKEVSNEHTREDSGRIPEKEQLSTPNLDDTDNQINISFNTELNTKLTDSIIFDKRARIVRTFYKSLSPSSIFEISIEHSFGNGIHLNSLLESIHENPNHPIDYVIVIETFGDRRGKIETIDNIEDEGFYQGYSPVHIQFEFEHKLTYLTEEMRDGSNETIIYKTKKRDLDFDKETKEEKQFREEFHPDRSQKFNVNFDNIIKNNDRKIKGKEYKLIYDENTINLPSTLESVQDLFEKSGSDPTFVDENNLKFAPTFAPHKNEDNDRNPPSTSGPTP